MAARVDFLYLAVVTVTALDAFDVVIVHVIEAYKISVTIITGEIAVNRGCECIRIDVDRDFEPVTLAGHLGVLVTSEAVLGVERCSGERYQSQQDECQKPAGRALHSRDPLFDESVRNECDRRSFTDPWSAFCYVSGRRTTFLRVVCTPHPLR
jgi:hypothetical protein